MAIYQLGDKKPVIPASCYIAESATIIGDVTLGERVSVLSGAVLRGDNEPITIGDDSNVQDNAVLHTDPGAPLTIGKGVTIGHQVMLHGCTIGDGSLIGINSVVMNGAKIGPATLIGANSLIAEGKEIPGGVLVLGSPGKIVRELKQEEKDYLLTVADGYVTRSRFYAANLKAMTP